MTEKYLVPLQFEAPSIPIVGLIAGRQDKGVGFCQLSSTAHFGVRTSEIAGGPGAGNYKIAIALRGRVVVSQYERRVCLRPGEIAVYDTSDEYSVGSLLPFGAFIALVPRAALDVRADRVTAVSATALGGPRRVMARELLLSAARHGEGLDSALHEVSELVRSSPAAVTGRSQSDQQLLSRAIKVVGDKLADHRLGPDYLAGVLGTSRRRLYQLFDSELGPIAEYIRSERMRLARTLLSSASWSDAPISHIAAECGVPDQAHFSRLFTRAHGQAPRQFRVAETTVRVNQMSQGVTAPSTVSGT